MEQFKLRDIEEFDNDFKNSIIKKENEIKSTDNLIPNLKPQENEEIFSGESVEEEPTQIEKDRQKIFENVISDNYENESEDGYHDEAEEHKKPKGLVVCKIASIVLLVATVLIFISGCFVSVFLDNNGLSIGGLCFNTQCQNIDILGIHQGDMIISKKSDINIINSDDVICVPSINDNGCDVQIVKNTYQNGPDEILYTIAFDDGYTVESAISNDQSYGVVKRYIPKIGKVINFAMQNALLDCVLFILIAALWCAILIIVEKKFQNLK